MNTMPLCPHARPSPRAVPLVRAPATAHLRPSPARQQKRAWRVISEDGKVEPLKKMRITESRLNFVIEAGKIVRVRRG